VIVHDGSVGLLEILRHRLVLLFLSGGSRATPARGVKTAGAAVDAEIRAAPEDAKGHIHGRRRHAIAELERPVLTFNSAALRRLDFMATQETKNKGWAVTFSGTGINLALGGLYAWSVFKGAIEAEVDNKGAFTWDKASLNDPYSVAVLVFAFMMVPAGYLLDKYGPRVVSTLGGLLVGCGFVLVSFSSSLTTWIVGFGCLAGTGLGLAYASATPAAVKWFPAKRTGLIAGLVVSGFGLASAYIAPLGSYLLTNHGISKTMLWLGIGVGAIVILLSQVLSNPPKGYVPGGAAGAPAPGAATKKVDSTWKEMMKTPTFWILWCVYFIGAGAGLMVISHASKVAKTSMAELAWVAVALLAVGNAAGRIISGLLSDKIGRQATLITMLLFQAVMIFLLTIVPVESAGAILAVACLIGFNYGSNLSLFPSVTKDFFGLKGFGLNYGIMFTAWGVGGSVLSRVSEMIKKETGSLDYSCYAATGLLVLAALLTLMVRPPKGQPVPQPAGEVK
jgi:nitrate/nitrite transporter NarK